MLKKQIKKQKLCSIITRSICNRKPKKIWTKEEDLLLTKLIEQHGPNKWSFIAQNIEGRQGKQCRERWFNHLNPEISKDQWSDTEEWVLFLLHKLYGNKWAVLTQLIKGRTDNSIKNHWNSIMKRKLGKFDKLLQDSLAQNHRKPNAD